MILFISLLGQLTDINVVDIQIFIIHELVWIKWNVIEIVSN